jgi:hypothetical protein
MLVGSETVKMVTPNEGTTSAKPWLHYGLRGWEAGFWGQTLRFDQVVCSLQIAKSEV